MAVKSNLVNMTVCLAVCCLVCSAVLAGVNSLTRKPIEEANRKILEESLRQVLPDGVEISEAKDIEVGGKPSQYYEATKDGEIVAFAVKSVTVGFGGPLELMVGIMPGATIYNTSVLSCSETPGLGLKCMTDKPFMNQWKGKVLDGSRLAVTKDGGDINAITASTITSRAYTEAVQNAVDAIAAVPMPISSGALEDELSETDNVNAN